MKLHISDIYSLHSAWGMQRRARSGVEPVQSLQAQIERGFFGLRFGRELEADFCHYLRISGRLSRTSLLLLAFVGILIVVLLEKPLLALPEALLMPASIFHFGVMIPAALVCGVFCWYRPYSRAIEPAMIVFFIAMNIGMLGQRVVAAPYGFDVPVEMSGITVVAMFGLARIRFWLMLPAAIAVFVATIFLELLLVQGLPNDYYHLFSASLLLMIGIMVGYSSEYFIRLTWLNATLLRYMSRLDGLTGLLNRHTLEDALAMAHAHARREGFTYGLAMVDIDAFGAYNDHYGHQLGDVALRRVAGELNATARRPQDVCGRYGGEEFALLWMGGSAEELRTRADQVRATVENSRIPHDMSPVAPWVTVSIGLCLVNPDEPGVEPSQALGKADRLLYEAKASGRNRLVSGCFSAAERSAMSSGASMFGESPPRKSTMTDT